MKNKELFKAKKTIFAAILAVSLLGQAFPVNAEESEEEPGEILSEVIAPLEDEGNVNFERTEASVNLTLEDGLWGARKFGTSAGKYASHNCAILMEYYGSGKDVVIDVAMWKSRNPYEDLYEVSFYANVTPFENTVLTGNLTVTGSEVITGPITDPEEWTLRLGGNIVQNQTQLTGTLKIGWHVRLDVDAFQGCTGISKVVIDKDNEWSTGLKVSNLTDGTTSYFVDEANGQKVTGYMMPGHTYIRKRYATGVTLDTIDMTMTKGDNVTLTAGVLPSEVDQNVQWTSSDTNVVTVNQNGQVQAVGSGTATITATSYNAQNGSVSTSCTVRVVSYVAMLRLYNPNTGEHFYTASDTERTNLVSVGWNYEGIAWYAPDSSNTPIYRLFNPNTGDHHYTGSMDERKMLVNAGWEYEGIGWYSDDRGNSPMYRMYNPNATVGAHHYTGSAEERETLVSLGWNYEGISWNGK